MAKKEFFVIMETKAFMRIIRDVIHDERTKEESRVSARHFTRSRKLPFPDLLYLLLDMQKSSLHARLNLFFSKTRQAVSMTQQALSKARNHFDHTPFEKMLRRGVLEEYSSPARPKWKGYHLLAVDGSTAQLPDTPQTREYFGCIGRHGGHPCVGMSILYDVENTWVIDPIFTSVGMDERKQLLRHVSYLTQFHSDVAANALLLLDRGYPSTAVFKALEQAGVKYLCRCSKSFLTAVNQAGAGDSIVEQNQLKLRVYKFALRSGQTETLVTNLFDADCADFPELYAKRWGIETAYNTLKNKLCVESFSGKTVNSILQDLWASMVLMNVSPWCGPKQPNG